MLTFLPSRQATSQPANQLNASVMSEAGMRPMPAARQQNCGASAVLETDAGRGPAEPGTEAGRGMLSIGLALVGVCGAATLALVASRAAEPLLLTVMAALATVGVFFLFALAAQHVQFGRTGSEGDLLRGIIDGDDAGILVTDGTGHAVAHNRAFAALAGNNALGDVNSIDTLLAADRSGAETMFRLARAAERGEPACEELRLPGPGGAYGRWLRVSVKPISLPGAPEVHGMRLWRVEDVTFERVRQGDAVRALEVRLANYASAPIGLLSVDKGT